jgi:hypothetical protein
VVVRRRRVRVHFVDRTTSLEGIQVARSRSDLILEAPQVPSEDPKQTIDLEGRIAIPRQQILFVQQL